MAKKPKKDDPQDLNQAITNLDKKYGAGSLMKGGGEAIVACDSIPTGAMTLDAALGVGGIPKGRITEVYGPEGCGKTTLTLHLITNVQRGGDIAVFVDAEHALDPKYAANIGVQMGEVYISQPDSGEQALEIVETVIKTGKVSLVVVDSVAALVPQAELDGEMGAHHVGAQARLLSQAMRKLKGLVRQSNTALVFINQLREKVGFVMGNPETTPGGRALKFYASCRVDLRRTGSIKKGDTVLGNSVRAKIVKNKVAPPFRTAEFDIVFGQGMDNIGCVLDQAVNHKILSVSGSWYTYGTDRIGNGREAAKEFLRENADTFTEIENKVRDILFPDAKVIKEEEPDDDVEVV